MIKKTIIAACYHTDETIRTLGIIRVTRVNYDLGLEIIKAMSDKVLWFGIPRISKLEIFANCLFGLLFEKADNRRLRHDLYNICNKLVKKTFVLRPAIWFLPPIGASLLTKIPDDQNPQNLNEIKKFKNELRKRPDLVNLIFETINHIDPSYGSDEQLRNLVKAFHPNNISNDLGLIVICIHSAVISRVLTGSISALDMYYEYWHWAKETNQVGNQELMWALRLIQIGLRLNGDPPMDDTWTQRCVEGIRYFYYHNHGIYKESKEYVCGSMYAAFAYLARQTGNPELPIIKELIDHSCNQGKENSAVRKKARNQQLDAILMRAVETDAIEIGTFDPVARNVAFYGLRCFLDNRDMLDDFLWERIITLLSRMQTYYAEGVEKFLTELPRELSDKLRIQMNQTLSRGNIGLLKVELLYASVLGEPVSQAEGLRPHWQNLLRIFYSPKSVTATLREFIKTLIRLMN
ncbi:MAG: hypothetical protein GY749_27495 [Desulfobacteraceae bacterium]|nr:hypothetical protein [Desulfobacteraceae bacterium]